MLPGRPADDDSGEKAVPGAWGDREGALSVHGAMRLSLTLALLVVTACGGPRDPGFKPNEVLAWDVTSAAVEFGQCSDHPEWRDGWNALVPDLAASPAYFAVGVDASGTKADQLECDREFRNCAVTPNGPIFAVAGTELFAGANFKSPATEGGTCNMAVAVTQLIVDQGETMVYTESLLFTLVDDEVECAEIETQLQALSGNHLGVEGCAITYRYEGALR